MSPPILTSEPSSINAGDTAKWLISLADYPASDGWALAYTLVNASTRITFSAAAQGDDHLVNIAPATTNGWAVGDYDYRAVASLSGESYTVRSGRISIKPAFSAAVDVRSHARRTLEAIEATLEGRASSATAEYEIAGRKMKYIPVPELMVLRDRFRADVRNEDAAARVASGAANPGRVFVRFGP